MAEMEWLVVLLLHSKVVLVERDEVVVTVVVLEVVGNLG